MRSAFSNLFKEFRPFAVGPGKTIFFTALFYALWVVINYYESADYELKSFAGRMTGAATLNHYDISVRVGLFYRCVFIFFGMMAAFYAVAFAVNRFKKEVLAWVEVKMINYIALAGTFYFLFHLFEPAYKEQIFKSSMRNCLELVYFLHRILIAGMIARFIFRKNSSQRIVTAHYAILLVLSFSLYFIVADLLRLALQDFVPDFLACTTIIALLLVIVFHWRRQKHDDSFDKDLRLFSVLSPLAIAPFLSFLKDEVFLVLKGKGIHFQDPLPIYFILLLLVALAMLRIYLQQKKKLTLHITLNRLLALRYFPLLVFSLSVYTLYSHYLNSNTDFFEAANKYLPIMEFKKWGVVPILEKYNSHVLSDFLFSGIYASINGISGHEIELYDFMTDAINVVLYYYLFFFITRNPYIALFSTIFYPFHFSMCPGEHPWALFSIFILFKVIEQKASFRLYTIFFSTLVLLILWRIDVGFACVFTLPLILLFYHFTSKRVKLNFKLLLLSCMTVMAVFGLAVLIISWVRGFNVFENAQYILNYLQSFQTYGYMSIGTDEQPYFKMHYFVFPFVIVLILLFMLLLFKRLNVSRKQRLAYLSLLVIVVYYISNFQRGLVRHGLIESTDSYVSSFVYVIIPISIFVFLYKLSTAKKFILFSVTAFFILFYNKSPYMMGETAIYEKAAGKFKAATPDLDDYNSRTLIKKVIYPKTVAFFKNELKDDETFIDFNNAPMLYYYAEKITPSFFFQNPISSHNEFLQKGFVKDLAKYNAPYLVFERTDPSANTLDGVQNIQRHYRMAEYFYNNYTPYIEIEDFHIWRKNDRKPNNHEKIIFNYTSSTAENKDTLKAQLHLNPLKNYLLKVVSDTAITFNLQLAVNGNPASVLAEYAAGKNSSVAYYKLPERIKDLEFICHDRKKLKQLTITGGDHLPDFSQELFKSADLVRLPYIWGAYDKEYSSEPVQFEKSVNKRLAQNDSIEIQLSENIDKTSGNSVIISINNHSAYEPVSLFLYGGTEKEKRFRIRFELPAGEGEKKYVFRISSFYQWYNKDLNYLYLSNPSPFHVTVSKIQVTKGK